MTATSRRGLYGGDRETRIQQEIVLGIGGVRALNALGIEPAVFHLNEGHAAFVVLQRLRDLIEQGSTFDDALGAIRATTVFTTHTPVPAGHDAFPFELVEHHLASCWGTLGANRDQFLALGAHDAGGGAQFNMTALALRSAGAINAVSQLHGVVTRSMWGSMLARAAGGGPSSGRDHQRRSRPDLDCRRAGGLVLRGTSAPTGGIATTMRRCGTRCSRFPITSSGRSVSP